MSYTTPMKTASVRFEASGIWYAIVTSVDGPRLYVKVPRLSGELVYGPLNAIGPNTQTFAQGEQVVVSFIEGRQDDLIVLGRIQTGTEALPE